MENLDRIFLEQATSKRKMNEKHKNGYCSLSFQKWEKLILNEKETHDPMAENWSKKHVSWIDLPLHMVWSKNRETKIFQQKYFSQLS